MEFPRKLAAAVALSAIALVFAGVGFLAGMRAERSDLSLRNAHGLELIEEAYRKIVDAAAVAPDEDLLARGAIRGMIEALSRADPYALFYSPSGYRSFQELATGRFSGIGVWLKLRDDALEIVSILPGTPARAAGLRKGDVILEIGGRNAMKMSSDVAVGLIKGAPGTKVDLVVRRGTRELEFTLQRATIELPNLRSSLVGDIGYLRLFGFAHGAAEQARARVEDLVDRGARGLVLDLRDNGGGLFEEAVEIASLFIEDGEVVVYRTRGQDDVVYDARGDAFEDIPLVVLVNGGTASASEIVAAAIQDRDRGVVVGSTTYGKGSVQEVVTLGDTSALKLTIATYLTPSGESINGRGIRPDVVVKAGAQVQRRRAFAVLRGLFLSASPGG